MIDVFSIYCSEAKINPVYCFAAFSFYFLIFRGRTAQIFAPVRVIAVMFTFSFGTAIAATPTPGTGSSAEYLSQAKAEIAKELLVAKNTTVEALANTYTETVGSVNVTIPKSVYEQIATKHYNWSMNMLEIAYTQLYPNAATAAYGSVSAAKSALVAENAASGGTDYVGKTINSFTVDATTPTVTTYAYAEATSWAALVLSKNTTPTNNVYLKDTLKLAFPVVKEYVLGEVAKVNLNAYPETIIDPNATFKQTHKALAQKVVDEIKDAVNDVTLDSAADLDAVKAALEKIQLLAGTDYLVPVPGKVALDGTVLSYTVKPADYTDNTTAYAAPKTALDVNATALKTDEALLEQDAQDDATKAGRKAQIQQLAAQFYSDAINDSYSANTANTKTAAQIKAIAVALAKDEADAFVEVWNSRIENEAAFTAPSGFTWTNAAFDKDTEAIVATASNYGNNNTLYTATAKQYEDLETVAKAAKVMVDATGTLVYDSKAIDELLPELKIGLYKSATPASYADDAERLAALASAKVGAVDLDWLKQVEVARATKLVKKALYENDGTSKYYSVEEKKALAKLDAYVAKVNACTTKAQVNNLTIGYSAAALITGTVTDKATVRSNIASLTGYADEKAKIDAYVTYKNGTLSSFEAGYIPFSTTGGESDLATFYAKNDARTNAEITALLEQVKAHIDSLPNKGALDKQKADVEAMVKALPNAITLADKEAVKAAYDAYDNYGGNIDNYGRLQAAIAAVQSAESTAIDNMIKALPAVGNVTVADKEAVKAITDAIDVYKAEAMYAYPTYTNATRDINDYCDAVRDAEKANVIAQIAALPADATKAQVEAVRALVDAFVGEYTDAEAGYKAADQIVNIDKLAYAEAQLVANAEENAKAYVQDLKIAARSTKTSKGVKVTIKADVQPLLDDGFTVEYKFYRSTKSNKGFKAMVTKTTGTYTNTKGVKGTKYYYKVKLVVKNAEGEVVATTPLTQCLYATRTF